MPRAANALKGYRSANIRQADNESWMIVYLDIITLLLAVFVVLLAHSNERIVYLEELKDKPIFVEESINKELQADEQKFIDKKTPELLHEEMALRLQEQLLTSDIADDLKIIVEAGRINLQMSEKILFQVGRASLKDEAGLVLEKIAQVLRSSSNNISVEGHTDNIPIRSQIFPSNWELSSARASVVLRYLAQQGIDPTRMRAIGYADTKPIKSNQTFSGQSENRRVTLVIHIDN